MATLTTGKTWVNAETITATKLNNTVNAATIADIVNADIKSDAAIVDTKLAQIATAGKVSGAALTSLANIPSGAGDIPKANLDGDWDTDGALAANSDVKLATQKATKTYSDTKIANPASGARGDILYHNGTNYVRLAKGTDGQYLKIGANDPAWASVSTGFGAWASRTIGTVYQAETDGFVVGRVRTRQTDGEAGVFTDSSNPPTTQRVETHSWDGVWTTPFCVPVKKGDYYKVTSGSESTFTPYAYWIPLG